MLSRFSRNIRIDFAPARSYAPCMSSPDTVRATLQIAMNAAVAYLEKLDCMPVAAATDLANLRGCLAKPLTDEPVAAEHVITELARDANGGILGSASGRFFGWGIGGSLPAAIAADWLVSAWDQNAALYSTGPAAAVVEEVVGSWLKDLLTLPADASFARRRFLDCCDIPCRRTTSSSPSPSGTTVSTFSVAPISVSARCRVALVGILHRNRHDSAGPQVHRVLGFVGEMRLAVLHLLSPAMTARRVGHHISDFLTSLPT